MSVIKRDGNYSPGGARVDDPIAFYVTRTSVTASTWYRFCHTGNTGNADGERTLDLKSLPTWLTGTHFDGWKLKVLNSTHVEGGVAATLEVDSINSSGVATLKDPIFGHDALPDDGVHWVLFPDILFPVGVVYKHTSSGPGMEIGVGQTDAYAPTVRKILDITRNTTVPIGRQIRATAVDRLFYRFGTGTGSQIFEWGEIELMM